MRRLPRLRTTTVALASLITMQSAVPLFASEPASPPASATSISGEDAQRTPRLTLDVAGATAIVDRDSRARFAFAPEFNRAGQVYPGAPYPYPHHSNNGSIAAIMIGAAAAITGSAILIYANRPECSVHLSAGGCGYGTKVVGGAVLAGGVVGLFVGALTWH